jgi:hypothetical protein
MYGKRKKIKHSAKGFSRAWLEQATSRYKATLYSLALFQLSYPEHRWLCVTVLVLNSQSPALYSEKPLKNEGFGRQREHMKRKPQAVARKLFCHVKLLHLLHVATFV